MRHSPWPDRFWEKVDASGDCWIWTGASKAGQYGHTFVPEGERVNGRRYSASHRVAYQLLVGPIPDGLVIDHLCRNPPCVNPTHLEPVTVGDNNRRAPLIRISIARQRRATGDEHALGRRRACNYGHPFDADNTGPRNHGHGRLCKECARAKQARYKARRLHGVSTSPRPRSGDRNLSGAGVDRQTASSDAQPVGASAPERQRPPSGGFRTG